MLNPGHLKAAKPLTAGGALFGAFVGLLFTGIGAAILVSNLAFARTAIKVEGTIVRFYDDTRVEQRVENGVSVSETKHTYYPEIKFAAKDGQEITFKSNIGSSRAPLVGSTEEVLYDPKNPNNARVASALSFWGFPLIFIAVGLLALIAGTFQFIKLKRRAASTETPVGPGVTERGFVAPGQAAPPTGGGFMPNAGAVFGAAATAPAPPRRPVNPDLMNYIKTACADGKGAEPAQIKKALTDAGWDPAEVDRAMTTKWE
jgi:hypothetical protein